MIVRLFAVLLLTVMACEEPSDGCEVAELRCEGQTLELCNSLQQWEEQYVCPDFGLVCCRTEKSFDCLERCGE